MRKVNTTAITIIVPVYNAEKYLCRCLDSILSQTFTDYEVILVDDGSKDLSGKICDIYAVKDSRFRVIHKENEGVSIARQTGLDAAKGTYIIHADPDDWVEPNWLDILYKKIEEDKADMVICDFERIFKDRKIRYTQKPTSYNQDDLLKDFINGKLWGPCWNKLIKRECFTRNNVSFHPEMNLWEDLYVICALLIRGLKVTYIPQMLYHYDSVINENSIVMHREKSHIISGMIFIDTFSTILSSKIYADEWFNKKFTIKKWIFLMNDCNYSIKNIYSEINEQCIIKANIFRPWSLETCIALCIKGHEKIAYFLFNTFNRILLSLK